jgi:hypothetical protein
MDEANVEHKAEKPEMAAVVSLVKDVSTAKYKDVKEQSHFVPDDQFIGCNGSSGPSKSTTYASRSVGMTGG